MNSLCELEEVHYLEIIDNFYKNAFDIIMTKQTFTCHMHKNLFIVQYL